MGRCLPARPGARLGEIPPDVSSLRLSGRDGRRQAVGTWLRPVRSLVITRSRRDGSRTTSRFPPNCVTTIAEWCIAFLVGASTNRTDRHTCDQADRKAALEKLIHDELQTNIEMTNDVRGMAPDMKAQLPGIQGASTSMARVMSMIDPTYAAYTPASQDSRVGWARGG
jgi:hypothetical protein